MKLIEITVQPVYWLELTREDLEPVFICAERHYDGACLQAARPGGFLHNWRGQISAFHDAAEQPWKIRTESHQLDIFLKICEPSRSLVLCKCLTSEQAKTIDALCAMMLAALRRGAEVVNGTETIRIEQPTQKDQLMWSMSPGRF